MAEDSKLLKDTYVLHLGDPDTSRNSALPLNIENTSTPKSLLAHRTFWLLTLLLGKPITQLEGGIHELLPSSEPEDLPETVNLIGNGECFHCQQKGHLARDCPIANRVVK